MAFSQFQGAFGPVTQQARDRTTNGLYRPVANPWVNKTVIFPSVSLTRPAIGRRYHTATATISGQAPACCASCALNGNRG